jgi:mono/diheme cytochrome c family protein
LAAVRRPLIGLAVALLAVGVLAGGLAWLLDNPRPPAGAGRGERLYYAYCVTCHGVDGRGSWRAALFLLRPGDLTGRQAASRTDRYLFDIIKQGGDPFGRPGMPAFRFLSDADVEALVGHVRSLAAGPGRSRGTASAAPTLRAASRR